MVELYLHSPMSFNYKIAVFWDVAESSESRNLRKVDKILPDFTVSEDSTPRSQRR
jgi:hypothetical protein